MQKTGANKQAFMSKITKWLFVIGAALFLYGYFARVLKIYFFWDSRALGFMVLVIGFIFYSYHKYQLKRRRSEKSLPSATLFFLISFAFCLGGADIFFIKTSEAYEAATDYFKNDSTIQSRLGKVRSFGLIPYGSIQSRTLNGVETGDAVLHITVRGEKKIADFKVVVRKEPDIFWMVISVE